MLLPVFERRVNNEKSLYFADDWILVKVTRFGHIGRGKSVKNPCSRERRNTDFSLVISPGTPPSGASDHLRL